MFEVIFNANKAELSYYNANQMLKFVVLSNAVIPGTRPSPVIPGLTRDLAILVTTDKPAESKSNCNIARFRVKPGMTGLWVKPGMTALWLSP